MSLKQKIMCLKNKGLSYSFMAKQVGLDRTTISKFVADELSLTIETQAKIESFCDKLLKALN